MVTRRQINRIARQVAERLSPERIILFGSYAYGTPTEDSDVDLLVVKRMRGNVFKMAAEIYGFIHSVTGSAFSVDVIVRTPAELKRRIALNDFFLREITEKGAVVYDSDHRGMGIQSGSGLRRRAKGTSRPKIAKLGRERLKTLGTHAVNSRYPGTSAGKPEAREAVETCRLVRERCGHILGLPSEP
jgi:predicted nucleotidyltransferase